MIKVTYHQPSIKSQLLKVRKIIESGWNQLDYARDALGAPVGVDDPEAISYCIAGACAKATNYIFYYTSANYDKFRKLRDILSDQVNQLYRWPYGAVSWSAVSWNDEPGRTQQDVLDLIDSIIASLDNT